MKKVNLVMYEKLLMILIIIDITVIDFFKFHDFLKAEENYTLVDYLVGLMSILIMLFFMSLLMKNRR